MKNRKIISFICAIAMIMSVFAGLTTVSAAGSKGISLDASMNDTATELTVVVKAVGMTEGVSAADVRFSVPEAQVDKDNVTYVSKTADGKDVEWTLAVNDGQVKMNFFKAAAAQFPDDVLATVTIPLTSPLTTDYTATLGDKSTIKDSVEYFVGDGEDQMAAVTSTAKNPIAKTQKPAGGKPPVVQETEPVPVPPAADKKGIKLDASLSADNMTLTVVVTALNMTEGVSAADVRFSVPEAQVDKDNVTYVSKTADGKDVEWTLAVNDGQVKMNFFKAAAAQFPDNVLATVTIPLTSPIASVTELKLGDKSTIKDSVEYFVGDGDGKMTATSTVVRPNEVKRDSTTVDLEDYMGVDKATGKDAETVAKEAEEDTTGAYGDLWIDVQITKENDNGERVAAEYGSDFAAWYDLDGDGTKEKLTKAQYENLISGNTPNVKMSDVIKGLQFEVYDSAKNVQIQTELFAQNKETSLLNKNENQDVNQGPPPTYKAPTISANPASKTYYVGDDVSIKFSYDSKDYANDGQITLNVPSDILDSAAASGVKVSYTGVDGDKGPTALTAQELDGNKVLTDIAAKGSVTVTFKAALKTSKTLEVTAKYDGSNEKKEASNVKAAVSKVTIKEKTNNDGGGSSSDSDSSTSKGGNGSIANGNQNGNASGYIGAFTDMAGYDWAQQAVTALSLKHIISGRGDGTFDPAGQITRAEYAQMLINAIGKSSEYADTTFNDVPTDSWFYHNVAVAAQLGIVSGYGDGNFGPYDLITREQMALMTQKAAVVMNKALVGSVAASFTDDADIADWSKAAVYELANAGIINGMGDGTFAPKANATRAQAAVIIFNTFVK